MPEEGSSAPDRASLRCARSWVRPDERSWNTASYFRTYCDVALTSDRDAVAESMLPVLLDLKAQIGEWRQALIALTRSQSGIWRRPAL